VSQETSLRSLVAPSQAALFSVETHTILDLMSTYTRAWAQTTTKKRAGRATREQESQLSKREPKESQRQKCQRATSEAQEGLQFTDPPKMSDATVADMLGISVPQARALLDRAGGDVEVTHEIFFFVFLLVDSVRLTLRQTALELFQTEGAPEAGFCFVGLFVGRLAQTPQMSPPSAVPAPMKHTSTPFGAATSQPKAKPEQTWG
jgi:hypothetical protein